jgi:hypothetical protein
MEGITIKLFKTSTRKLIMEKQSVYNLRLVSFALHLKKLKGINQDIQENPVGFREGTNKPYLWLYYNANIFQELPNVFPEDWFHIEHFSDMFFPVLKDYPLDTINILDAVSIFFDLDNDEMAHCFDLGIEGKAGMQDNIKYGGMQLYRDASPQDIAYNIHELVKKRIIKL